MGVSSTISVSFPVKAHVRKYLLRQYGSAHVVSRNNLLGMLVLHSLDKTYEKPDKITPGLYKYTLLVPEFYSNVVGKTLPRNTQQHLSELCTHIFNMAMFTELDNRSWAGEKVVPALKAFLKHYGITEDDMKEESLYKAYQRHCEKKVNNYPAAE